MKIHPNLAFNLKKYATVLLFAGGSAFTHYTFCKFAFSKSFTMLYFSLLIVLIFYGINELINILVEKQIKSLFLNQLKPSKYAMEISSLIIKFFLLFVFLYLKFDLIASVLEYLNTHANNEFFLLDLAAFTLTFLPFVGLFFDPIRDMIVRPADKLFAD